MAIRRDQSPTRAGTRQVETHPGADRPKFIFASGWPDPKFIGDRERFFSVGKVLPQSIIPLLKNDIKFSYLCVATIRTKFLMGVKFSIKLIKFN